VIVNKTRDLIGNYKDNLVQINQVTINTSKSILFNNRNALVNMSSQILSRPKIIVYNRLNDLQNTVSNLKSFNTIFLKKQQNYLNHYITVIKMMSPANILKKGFAIVKTDNRITSNPDDIKVGSDIEIILSDTKIRSTVKQKSAYDGTEFDL
jgi:exodeoxyribonuclease VII large subunit